MHDAMSHDLDAPAYETLLDGIRFWVYPDGTALRVVSGGSDDGDGSGSAGDGDDGSGDGDGDLGEGGKKALSAERAARRKAEQALKTRDAELVKLREAAKSDSDKALDAARQEGEKAAISRANERILRAEIKAAAAGKLADPDDAIRLLDLDQFSVADNGDVDTKAISSAIAELVKAKPYLAATAKGKPGALPGGGAKQSDGVSMNDIIRRAAGVNG